MKVAARIFGYGMVFVAAYMIAATRVAGCHMTEGELLAEHWGVFLVALIVGGLGMLVALEARR